MARLGLLNELVPGAGVFGVLILRMILREENVHAHFAVAEGVGYALCEPARIHSMSASARAPTYIPLVEAAPPCL